jgi:HK97 family phage major capsid protein
MSDEIKSKIDQIGQAWEATKKTQDAIEAKLEKNEGNASELKQQMDRIDADLNEALDMKKRLESLEASTKRIADNVELAHSKAEEKGVDLGVYASALKKVKLAGKNNSSLTEAETKALRENVAPDGGYTVMPFMGDITKIIFDTSPVRALASTVTIGSDLYRGYFDDDEIGVSWGNEVSSLSENSTPDIGELNIKVHDQFAVLKATESLLEDSSWNLAAWLQEKARDKFGRSEATEFVVGNSTSRPSGLCSADVKTSNGEVYERGKVGTLVAAGAAAIASDELINLRALLKPAYRSNAYLTFNRKTESYLRKLKDGQNNYLWQPSYQMGVPDTLIGQRTAIFEDMPDMGTGAISVVLADIRSTYLIVDRVGMSVLEDPYSSFPQRLWKIRRRVGGGIQNFDSIKYLKQA